MKRGSAKPPFSNEMWLVSNLQTILHFLRKGKHVDLISDVQVLSMLVSYTDEEPNNSRKNSSDDYCSCEGEDRYKVSVGTYLEFRSHS